MLSTLLNRWGLLVARYRFLTLGAWLVALAAAGTSYAQLDARLGVPDYSVASSESSQTAELLEHNFPELGSAQEAVVFRSERLGADTAEYRATVADVLDTVRQSPHVAAVLSPYEAAGQVASDRRVALAVVSISGDDTARAATSKDVQHRLEAATAGYLIKAYLTGPSSLNNDLSAAEERDQARSEAIGLSVALLVLLIALGAPIAAALPVVLASSSVLVCLGLLGLLALPLHLDRFATVVASMIGTGVGIDYALFIVGRFREEFAKRVRRGQGHSDVAESVAVALRTSGATVVTSGLIVIVALGALTVIDGHIFTEIALTSSLVVAICVAAALTLLPALLAILGHGVNLGALHKRRARHRIRSRRWSRWAQFVLRHPVRLALPAFVALGVLALPTASMSLGFDLGSASLSGTPAGQGQRILTRAFGPGTVAPVDVVVCDPHVPLNSVHLDAVARLTSMLRADKRVADVTSLTDVLDARTGGHTAELLQDAITRSAHQGALTRLIDLDHGRRCTYLRVAPTSSVDSPEAATLVNDIRNKTSLGAFSGTALQTHVGGVTAQYVDLSTEVGGKIPVVVGVALALSFCYLLVAFRSLLLPLKAITLNIVSTAAALGVTVLVFQLGFGERILGFRSVNMLPVYLPIALFVMLFGLSMDYEVFLVSRIREEWCAGRGTADAITVGLKRTGGQISAAAAIMAAVFGSFVFGDVLEIKEFGFGLAVAVILDATVVRMVLVPVTMALAGAANWWLPQFLRRRNLSEHSRHQVRSSLS
ncbi:MMPL family transporter [Amycolatopsis sp. NPDC058986]|uniref:MMPL family transporter n=1 Tax=unclassified Amycolatopsis TaxID=2618356 RepID=UPI00366B7639